MRVCCWRDVCECFYVRRSCLRDFAKRPPSFLYPSLSLRFALSLSLVAANIKELRRSAACCHPPASIIIPCICRITKCSLTTCVARAPNNQLSADTHTTHTRTAAHMMLYGILKHMYKYEVSVFNIISSYHNPTAHTRKE